MKSKYTASPVDDHTGFLALPPSDVKRRKLDPSGSMANSS
jgi:hypothetical protein